MDPIDLLIEVRDTLEDRIHGEVDPDEELLDLLNKIRSFLEDEKCTSTTS